jgi:hypothetical protein
MILATTQGRMHYRISYKSLEEEITTTLKSGAISQYLAYRIIAHSMHTNTITEATIFGF